MDSAADRAASAIRALIASGQYRPGDRLPAERELAHELGVSRPALREGIRRLRSGGVLDARRGSGTYVGFADLEGVYDVRLRLEPLAAERAARWRSASELDAMERTVARMGGLVDDPDRYNLLDARFHELVAEASGSIVLAQTLGQLSELALLGRSVNTRDRRSRESALGDVERVLGAIARQHPKRAANAMERHLDSVRADYLRLASSDHPAASGMRGR